MEYRAKVRDGSEGGEVVDGFWTNQVVASDIDSNEITPLYMSLYSQNSPDFTSENDEILKAIDNVGTAVQNRGIWVIDRGGDRNRLYEPLLQNQTDFIIRMVGTRELIYQEEYARSLWLDYACKLPYGKNIVKIIKGKEVQFNLRFGYVPVHLPDMAGHVLKSARRVFGIPDFKYYALGDGLSNIFSRYPGRLQKQSEIHQSQLSFGFG